MLNLVQVLHVSSLHTNPWPKPMYRMAQANLTMKLNIRVCFLFFPCILISVAVKFQFRCFYFSSVTAVALPIWQMSLQKRLIYLAFLGFFITIRKRKAATVGQYLIASFSKFVARTFHMTNQRSKYSSLYCIACEACRIPYDIKNLNTLISKLQIPAASYLMELAAIDWFKDTKRMDNVGRQKKCVAQVTKKLS